MGVIFFVLQYVDCSYLIGLCMLYQLHYINILNDFRLPGHRRDPSPRSKHRGVQNGFEGN